MKRFKKVYIEITNKCNLTCSFCPTSKRKKEFMDEETFKHILENITPYTDFVCFHVKGEPLLHPNIGKYLTLCHDYNLKVNITTNGTRIKEMLPALIGKEALRQINFSIHSFGGKTGDGRLSYIDSIIQSSKELRKMSDILISYRFWNLGETSKESENRMMLKRIEEAYDLDYEIVLSKESERGIKLADKVFVNQDYEFEWPHMDKEEDDGVGFCHGLRNQVAILVDGTVIPCCLDQEGDIALGNIKITPFSDIINSERALNLYNGFSNRQAVEELCRKCGYRRKFGGK